MNEEYKTLRAETLAWQNRRFTVLATSVSLVTGILGFDGVTKGESILDWGLVSALLLFFLGSSAALTWYASRSNAKIAAYIIVFHQADSKGWETRLKTLKEGGDDRFNLNRMVVLIYAGLGTLSILMPWAVRGYKSTSDLALVVLTLSGVWFFFSLYLLLRPPSTKYFEEKWKDIGHA